MKNNWHFHINTCLFPCCLSLVCVTCTASSSWLLHSVVHTQKTFFRVVLMRFKCWKCIRVIFGAHELVNGAAHTSYTSLTGNSLFHPYNLNPSWLQMYLQCKQWRKKVCLDPSSLFPPRESSPTLPSNQVDLAQTNTGTKAKINQNVSIWGPLRVSHAHIRHSLPLYLRRWNAQITRLINQRWIFHQRKTTERVTKMINAGPSSVVIIISALNEVFRPTLSFVGISTEELKSVWEIFLHRAELAGNVINWTRPSR